MIGVKVLINMFSFWHGACFSTMKAKRYSTLICHLSALLVICCEVFACPPEGCDVGASGWEVSSSCSSKVESREAAVACFSSKKWIGVDREVIRKELVEGYVELGGETVLSKPGGKALKVYVFRRWAVDEAGIIYLHGELG